MRHHVGSGVEGAGIGVGAIAAAIPVVVPVSVHVHRGNQLARGAQVNDRRLAYGLHHVGHVDGQRLVGHVAGGIRQVDGQCVGVGGGCAARGLEVLGRHKRQGTVAGQAELGVVCIGAAQAVADGVGVSAGQLGDIGVVLSHAVAGGGQGGQDIVHRQRGVDGADGRVACSVNHGDADHATVLHSGFQSCRGGGTQVKKQAGRGLAGVDRLQRGSADLQHGGAPIA